MKMRKTSEEYDIYSGGICRTVVALVRLLRGTADARRDGQQKQLLVIDQPRVWEAKDLLEEERAQVASEGVVQVGALLSPRGGARMRECRESNLSMADDRSIAAVVPGTARPGRPSSTGQTSGR